MQSSRPQHVLMQAWAAQALPLPCLQTGDSMLLSAILFRLPRLLRADLFQGLSLSALVWSDAGVQESRPQSV